MIWQELDDKEIEIIKKAEEITITNYGLKGDLFPEDAFIDLIEELVDSYENLREEYEQLLTKDEDDHYVDEYYEEMKLSSLEK